MTRTHLLIRLLSIALALHLCGIPSALAMTYHHNDVFLDFAVEGYRLKRGTFTVTEFSVTEGQDPDGRLHAGLIRAFNGDSAKMTFEVGRHASKDVARWWVDRVKAYNNTRNANPSDLNFAVIGDLELVLTGGRAGNNEVTYRMKNIAFAQGHTGLVNDWWFGGKECVKLNTGWEVKCSATNGGPWFSYIKFFRHVPLNPNYVRVFDINFHPYATYPLVERYRGESISCRPNPLFPGRCPPYVSYLSDAWQRVPVRLEVKNGHLKMVGQTGLFDTTNADYDKLVGDYAAIYVMDEAGDLYASNLHSAGLFHHSSLLAGANVAGAGVIKAKNGEIEWIANCSGHYMPPDTSLEQVADSLRRQGYVGEIVMHGCSGAHSGQGDDSKRREPR